MKPSGENGRSGGTKLGKTPIAALQKVNVSH